MKHDINYEIGKDYYIDEDVYGKMNVVTLKHFWKQTGIFALVENEKGYEWETMLCRLTEIKEGDIKIPRRSMNALEAFKKED